jgi:hypothetical protein
MVSEELELTAQIVMSHASMTELSPAELLEEVKKVYGILTSLDKAAAAPAPPPQAGRRRQPRKTKMKKSPEAKSIQNKEGPEVGDPDYMDFMEHREG